MDKSQRASFKQRLQEEKASIMMHMVDTDYVPPQLQSQSLRGRQDTISNAGPMISPVSLPPQHRLGESR